MRVIVLDRGGNRFNVLWEGIMKDGDDGLTTWFQCNRGQMLTATSKDEFLDALRDLVKDSHVSLELIEQKSHDGTLPKEFDGKVI